MTNLSALYYPFSRCINEASLKQMLLVFEDITFLDPVLDPDFRAHLFRNLEKQEDPRFKVYRNMHSVFKSLEKDGLVHFLSPEPIQQEMDTSISAATISDLLDPNWVAEASSPYRYGLPHRNEAPGGKPCWYIFESKIPRKFVELLHDDPQFRLHLVHEGGKSKNWTLTYEAGSSAAINTHLAAAEKLSLAPVTDSVLHHNLLLRKAIRQNEYSNHKPLQLSPNHHLPHHCKAQYLSNL